MYGSNCLSLVVPSYSYVIYNPQLQGSTCTTESHSISAGKGLRDPKPFISLMTFGRVKMT